MRPILSIILCGHDRHWRQEETRFAAGRADRAEHSPTKGYMPTMYVDTGHKNILVRCFKSSTGSTLHRRGLSIA